jgi:hypothetical protein
MEGDIVKMLILPKEIYTFNTMPINISIMFLAEIGKLILKCILSKDSK